MAEHLDSNPDFPQLTGDEFWCNYASQTSAVMCLATGSWSIDSRPRLPGPFTTRLWWQIGVESPEDSEPRRVFVWSHLGPFCSACKHHVWWTLSRRAHQWSEITQAMKKQNNSWRYSTIIGKCFLDMISALWLWMWQPGIIIVAQL